MRERGWELTESESKSGSERMTEYEGEYEGEYTRRCLCTCNVGGLCIEGIGSNGGRNIEGKYDAGICRIHVGRIWRIWRIWRITTYV